LFFKKTNQKQFKKKKEIEDPKLVLIVGGIGLGANLIGLFLFSGFLFESLLKN